MGNSNTKINYVYERKQNSLEKLKFTSCKTLCKTYWDWTVWTTWIGRDIIRESDTVAGKKRTELISHIFSLRWRWCIHYVRVARHCIELQNGKTFRPNKSVLCVRARQNTVCQNEIPFMSADQKAGSIGWHFFSRKNIYRFSSRHTRFLPNFLLCH